MNKIIILAFIVFTSGCLHAGGSSGSVISSFGLNINDFSSDISSIESGDRFSLFLEVENNGGADAMEVHALLHGIPIGDDLSEFELIGGDTIISLGTIDGPDEVNKIPGDVDRLEWRLIAPEVSSGVSLNYEPKIRLLYGYRTIASTIVVALSADEHRRLQTSGESLPTQRNTLITKGPMSVTVDVLRDPVVIRDENDEIDLTIELRLLQRGTVFDPDNDDYYDNGEIDIDDLDIVGIEIEAPGVEAIDGQCTPFDDESKERLRGGKSLIISCELIPGTFVGVKEIPINVKVRYNFLADASTRIAISGR